MEEGRHSAARPGGYLLVLLGAIAFVGSCFLPYYDVGDVTSFRFDEVSLFRTMTFGRQGAIGITGVWLSSRTAIREPHMTSV